MCLDMVSDGDSTGTLSEGGGGGVFCHMFITKR